MAYASTSTAPPIGQYPSSPQSSSMPSMSTQQQPHRPRPISRHHWTASLSRDLHNFVIQLLPTPEEMAVKEDVRKLLERLIRTIEPESRLLSFGSTANGFSLRNSDMDLCCLIDSGQPPLNASDLVTMVGDLLERETKFKVKTLPHARIPIVKLSLDSSPGLPYGISCDIGFENRLALENTRLLMNYASIDPLRVRTLVIFLKVWSKRRKINSPYSGTLSSYGYVLLVIFFLVHVKNPPILPNLQQMPPLRPISHEDTHIGDYNIWFFDDIELLKERWQSSNTETVGDLLIDFFKYFSRDFTYNVGVASIRAGLLKKSSKGWLNDYKDGRYHDSSRDRNRFCIEDPFETDYNVARCVTKEGLYTIRGEFMRASRILSARPERTILALAQLCEEREDEFVRPLAPQPFVPPRLASVPAQPPYTVGSSALRPSDSAPDATTLLEDSEPSVPANPVESPILPQETEPPEHMAPKRGKWTSPPPPDDPDHKSYENRLGLGITLATSSTTARQPERSEASSSSSEILSDEEAHDRTDLESVGSFTSGDGLASNSKLNHQYQQLAHSLPKQRPLSFFASEEEQGWLVINTPKAVNEPLVPLRGRLPVRFGFGMGESSTTPTPTLKTHPRSEGASTPDSSRRSLSGPPGPTTSTIVPQAHLPGSSPTQPNFDESVEDDNTTGNRADAFATTGMTVLSYANVRTPFPLYQQSPAPTAINLRPHPMYVAMATTAPSHAFTAHHPAGVTGPSPTSPSIPVDMDLRRSWHQQYSSMAGSSQGSSAASSVPHSPILMSSVSARGISKQGLRQGEVETHAPTPTPATMSRSQEPAVANSEVSSLPGIQRAQAQEEEVQEEAEKQVTISESMHDSLTSSMDKLQLTHE